jgi:hypothetical protein
MPTIRRKIKASPEEVHFRYSNWLSMMIDIVKPKNLYMIGGRGTAKTEDIIAKRSIDVIDSMPRASFAFTADTYINAQANIIPTMLRGWDRQAYLEDYHWVADKEPPASFSKPHYRSKEHKHTIYTRNGCRFVIKSLDRPSKTAGISTTHNFGDEAKFQAESKLKKAFPTLRGDSVLYSHSPFFMGNTYLTDMPNPNDGEDVWILRMKENMNVQQIVGIFYTALEINKMEWELFCMKRDKMPERLIENQSRLIERWNERLSKLRKNSTFFMIVSSLVNIDILTFDYIVNQFETLQYEEFKTSILSLTASLGIGSRFYAELSDQHFYNDGYDYDYYDRFGLRDNISQTSEGLRYIQPNKTLEAGFDAGNMMSLVLGQEQGHEYRVLKDMYTLSPEWIPELGAKFVKFFEPHKFKMLDLYYDRAANNYQKSKKDFANQLKNAIEKHESGKRTGWKVILRSLGQGNIGHEEEFDIMNQMMGEKNSKLPRLLIDRHECPRLKSSLELAPLIKDKGKIKKEKKSEKLPLKRLPHESTNMSDAFKYLICRRKYMLIAKQKKS